MGYHSQSIKFQPEIAKSRCLQVIITELRVELHQSKTALSRERLERETRELWQTVLHIFFLRNDLLR